MNADAALYNLMVTNSTIQGLVGTRIYPSDTVPKNAPVPYVTFERTGDIPVQLMGGAASLYENYYDVDVFAATRGSLNSIEDAVVAVLQDYQGTSSSVYIQWIFLDNSYYNGYDEDIQIYHQTMEYIVWHEGS